MKDGSGLQRTRSGDAGGISGHRKVSCCKDGISKRQGPVAYRNERDGRYVPGRYM